MASTRQSAARATARTAAIPDAADQVASFWTARTGGGRMKFGRSRGKGKAPAAPDAPAPARTASQVSSTSPESGEDRASVLEELERHGFVLSSDSEDEPPPVTRGRRRRVRRSASNGVLTSKNSKVRVMSFSVRIGARAYSTRLFFAFPAGRLHNSGNAYRTPSSI